MNGQPQPTYQCLWIFSLILANLQRTAMAIMQAPIHVHVEKSNSIHDSRQTQLTIIEIFVAATARRSLGWSEIVSEPIHFCRCSSSSDVSSHPNIRPAPAMGQAASQTFA